MTTTKEGSSIMEISMALRSRVVICVRTLGAQRPTARSGTLYIIGRGKEGPHHSMPVFRISTSGIKAVQFKSYIDIRDNLYAPSIPV